MVAYDISKPKRLRRVSKIMKSYGHRVQKSVFECELEHDMLKELVKEVNTIINKREDKVQIYRLCGACHPSAKEVVSWNTSDPEVFII